MPLKVQPVPEGYHTLTPNLVVNNAAKAIEYYSKAFGARENMRMPGPDGRIMHAELEIGSSKLMLCDEMPDMNLRSPDRDAGITGGLYAYFPDVDAVWKRAVDGGATEISPLTDMFWGDRTGRLLDPFGHSWTLAQHTRDMTPEEIEKGQEEFTAQVQAQ